jgi:predicted branched-subunit amino acid permease
MLPFPFMLLTSKDFRAGFAEMLPACIGLVPFGLVCGVGAAAAGANWLGSLGMSAIIFSGAAQIVAAQMVAAGAPFAVIVLTTTVLGLRLLMYSAAIAPYLKPLPERWRRTLAFLLSDQVFAAAIRRFHIDDDREAAGRHFLGSGVALWLTWQIACMAGFLAGNLIPSSWSLEFAVPLCFLALLAPVFRDTPSILAGITAGIGVLALAHLPMRLNLIVAGLIGIAVGTLADLAKERWTAR